MCVLGRYREQWVGDDARKKSWCVESQKLMPLATDIYSRNVFQFMKLEESMAGEDSKPEETCSKWREHIFTIGKINFRSGIGLVAEFHGIPNKFPNQAHGHRNQMTMALAMTKEAMATATRVAGERWQRQQHAQW